jgi:hypothetical protein
MPSLIGNLTRSGNPPAAIDAPDGSRLLVLPSGGRVLALYPPASDENFLWTNPALATTESTEAYFRRGGWPNPGGDRTWLAPEIELFIGDWARPAQTYAVPATLDPGRWRNEAGQYALRLRNESTVHLKRSGREAQFSMIKEYRPAANPLRDLKLALSYAGYEQTTMLEIEADRNSTPPARLGLWSLLQLPKPGRMIIPTYRRTEPRTVFGQVPPGDLSLGNRALVWRMPDAGGNSKISVKAAALTGRAGYVYPSRGGNDVWNLVVRSFVVNLSGDYVDALWNDPADAGYAFQACAVNDGQETFNELEYHAPAVESVEGWNRSRDQSQLWAFRGGPDGIAEAARLLLGIEEDTTIFK